MKMGGWDLHIHTTFCDGDSTPEEMVQAAMERGLEGIGFSGHAPMPFDAPWAMTQAGAAEYRREVSRLKEKYRGRIKILLGVEQDYWCGRPEAGLYDYVIGSVHLVKKGEAFLPVDDSPEILRQGVDGLYGGDWYALAEDYFTLAGQVVEATGADMIGHFDLLTKFHEADPHLDLSHPRYTAAWREAADKLLETGKPFEINTGAISRGWRSAPYPHGDIIRYLQARGGRLILNSDSHSAGTVAFQFDQWRPLLERAEAQDTEQKEIL